MASELLPRAAQAAADRHLVARNLDVDALQVVLPAPRTRDGLGRGAARPCGVWRCLLVRVRAASPSRQMRPERTAGVRLLRPSATSSGVPDGDDLAAAGAPFGPQVDDPVGRFDHVQIVLDHQHRVAGVDEVVQHLQQHLDVGEVQAGRRLVEQVERLAGALLHQLAGQLDPLGLAAGERRRRLAELE